MSISVIAPVFNGKMLVRQFVECILSQTERPNAVIFVNDGSTDETGKHLCEACSRFEAIGVVCKIVDHDVNKGRGAARQAALEVVDTRYVTWLDIDDLYGPGRIYNLNMALAELETSQASRPWLISTPYTACQVSRIHVKRVFRGRRIDSISDLYNELEGPRTIQLQSLAGPVESFRNTGFDTGLNWAEDFDFLLRFLAQRGQVLTSEWTRAEDVLYFQSFDKSFRDEVADANRKVLRKNGEVLSDAGVDAQAEFQRKWLSYISKFSLEAARGDASLQNPAGEGVSSELTRSLPKGESRVLLEEPDAVIIGGDWVSPEGDATYQLDNFIEKPGGYEMPVSNILSAYMQGASMLRITSLKQGNAVLAEYEIFRDSSGVIGLNHLDWSRPHKLSDVNSSWSDSMTFAGRFVPAFSKLTCKKSPIYVSFFSGPVYYKECAERLAQKLSELGLDYQICEFLPEEDMDWKNVCRKKISYYAAQYYRHDRPIFWIDADSVVLEDPSSMLGSNVDLGAFLRNFSYLPEFDPLKYSRLLHPGYLLLGKTEKTSRFIAHMLRVDSETSQNATDDYVLQESLLTFPENLSFQIFPPDAIDSRGSSRVVKGKFFQHLDSGHVSSVSQVVDQHQARTLEASRQLPVLQEAAKAAMKRGELRDATSFYKRIRQVMPDDADSLVRLLSLYARLGENKKFLYHFDLAKKNPNLRMAALRSEFDRRSSNGEFDAAASISAKILSEGGSDDVSFIKSREYRYGFDREALLLGCSADERVPMMWWEQPFPGNLGDIIGPYIVRALTGVPPRYTKKSPRVLSVGSIIKFARQGDTVWGAGAAAASQRIDTSCDFRAVRGPLTRRLVLQAGADCPEVYGDPAWILPKIYPGKNLGKTHKVGIIRHFAHASRRISVGPGVREIDIIRGSIGEVERFLDEVNSCEAIVSTSLHGLIIANAYGIPACWAIDTNSPQQIHGDGMKFMDYAMSVGIEKISPLNLASESEIDASLFSRCTHNPARPVDCEKLISSAPFRVQEKYL
ncbi:glycosyltransferase [Limimaricola hongkongensis]|nr:glycosyltransferase [Limimaricola hongkongensis]